MHTNDRMIKDTQHFRNVLKSAESGKKILVKSHSGTHEIHVCYKSDGSDHF